MIKINTKINGTTFITVVAMKYKCLACATRITTTTTTTKVLAFKDTFSKTTNTTDLRRNMVTGLWISLGICMELNMMGNVGFPMLSAIAICDNNSGQFIDFSLMIGQYTMQVSIAFWKRPRWCRSMCSSPWEQKHHKRCCSNSCFIVVANSLIMSMISKNKLTG
mgnify:CR=1 FL=1